MDNDELVAEQQVFNAGMVKIFWKIGYLLSQLKYTREETLEKLQQFGKNFEKSDLLLMEELYHWFPNNDVPKELNWGHLVVLLQVSDVNLRNKYLAECLANHWTHNQLSEIIKYF